MILLVGHFRSEDGVVRGDAVVVLLLVWFFLPSLASYSTLLLFSTAVGHSYSEENEFL